MSRPLWQRLAVPIAAILVVVVVATAVVGVGLTRRAFPQTSGELELPGLTGEVEVVRDAQGVPRIYADSPEDLFRAQGFVAAQDRFFQMDLRRHVVSGRLAELVGEGGVETDQVIRTLGWRRVAEEELSLLSAETRSYLQAYASGVNAYIDSRGGPSTMSLEYLVLAQSAPGYQIRPWDAVDSLAWLKAMAWDLRGNYREELTRGRLVGQVPLNQLGTLYPAYPHEEHPPILSRGEWTPPDPPPLSSGSSRGGTAGPGPLLPPGQDPADVARLNPPEPAQPPSGPPTQQWLAGQTDALDDTVLALAQIPQLLGQGEGVGSNSWVVSGEHTSTGMPLLANDPHLGLSQPGVWMQAGLHCREVTADCPFDVSGFTFAGFPGVIIGQNHQIAWGLTNLDPDVTDFYLEETRGDLVRRENDFVPMRVREEVIRVAGGEEVPVRIRESTHGPIVSDVLDDVAAMGANGPLDGVATSRTFEVALAWTGLEASTTAEAVFRINKATGWEEFRDAAAFFAAPAQNLVYADVEGNIGYQAPGLVPIRESATHGTPPGFYPAPGWDPAYAWDGWVDFDDLPHSLNPEDGVIVTANQAVTSRTRPFLTSEYAMGYRSTRILELLQERLEQGPLTPTAMAEMQLDDTSPFALSVVPYLLDVELEGSFYTGPQQMLRDWDGSSPAEGEQSAAAAYFYAVFANLLTAVFDDELPPDLAVTGNSRSMLILEDLLADPTSVWWDDKRTPGVVETRDEVIRTALVQARQDLTREISKDPSNWTWGELHRATLRHEVLGSGDVPALVQGIFNSAQLPVAGNTSVVNAISWDASTGTFEVTAGPSMRMVADLADRDASVWVNQTGTSGHAFHPHYSDQTEAWVKGETYRWAVTREAVTDSAEQTLLLVPAPTG
ncbi:penicillin acylase family protein [Ornithinimicrobium sufpigmenti]|uniref:penicillin acylase family protein n=1 Tax=Ornithinimicrobium sufpigmenti TaxID=2508882 RepID=UPI001036B8D4|nr:MULTISPECIES: penicillin acylase family protein [unclassified Ornithinimicrobium]